MESLHSFNVKLKTTVGLCAAQDKGESFLKNIIQYTQDKTKIVTRTGFVLICGEEVSYFKFRFYGSRFRNMH